MRNESNFWKVIAAMGILIGVVMSIFAFTIKKKNDEYRDMLINLSEDLPEVED